MADYDFTKLESLLEQLRPSTVPEESTIFAVGGRSYYENPASDLLAFFLKPDAGHGLKDLFLSTFIECMELDTHEFKMTDVSVKREVQTVTGKFIDLQIRGTDWCLIIENKIFHSQNNPFKDYEAHAKSLGKAKTRFAILSPDGHSEADGWIGVSHKNYCKRLKEKLPESDPGGLYSKWQLFAREFILHIENLFVVPFMNRSQAAIFENYTTQIAELQKLEAQYRSFIIQELNRRLNESLPGCMFYSYADKWESFIWVFRCCSQKWGGSQLVLFKPEQTGGKFLTRVYLDHPSVQLLESARHALAYMESTPDRNDPYWTSVDGYDSSEKAIAKLCELAKIVNDLLKVNLGIQS